MANHSAKRANIDRLRIATPCPVSWEQMTGDKRVRFCGHCQLNVYNISELGRTEFEALVAATEGRICAKLYQRADGTILTKDCPVGLRALRMRVSKRAAAVLAAIASISSAALGQSPSGKDGKTSCTPQTRITRTSPTSDRAANILSGTVVDPNGAVVPGTRVTLTNANTKKVRQTSSNDEGRFEFASVEAGNYLVAIEASNFKSHRVTNVKVEKDKLINIDIVLEPSLATETVGILMAEPALIDTPPGTFIISGDLIRRLPIQ